MRAHALALVVLTTACTEEQKPAPVSSASVASSASAAPIAPQSSVTSSSKEAILAFMKGRDLADNAHEAEALVWLQKAVALDAKFALAHAYLGYYAAGADGEKSLATARSLAPTVPEVERLIIEELSAVSAGDSEKALKLARRVAEIAPFDWHAQLDLGRRLLTMRSYDEATEALKRAAAFGPASYAVYNTLGYLYLEQRKVESAIATFKRYAELKPDEPNALDSLGEALLAAGKLDDAEKTFTKAAEMKFSFAWVGVAQARFFRGDTKGAREAFGKARDLGPRPVDKLEVDDLILWASLGEKDIGKRIDAFEREAAESKVDEPHAFAPIYRAVVQLEAGKPDAALKDLDEAKKRSEKKELQGRQANRVRRAALMWRALAEARIGKGDAVQKTAALLADEASRAPNEPDVASKAAFAKGLAAFASGDKKTAAAELARCLSDDVVCQLELITVLDKLGDTNGRDAARDKLMKANLRDALYLYVRRKLAQE